MDAEDQLWIELERIKQAQKARIRTLEITRNRLKETSDHTKRILQELDAGTSDGFDFYIPK